MPITALAFQNTDHPKMDRIKQAPKIHAQTDARSQRVPNFLATDIQGNLFDFASHCDNQITVVALTSTSCPLCKKYGPSLAEIEKNYRSKGVQFVFIGSIPSDELKDCQKNVRDLGLTSPYLLDKTGEILTKLGAKTTTEAFVLNKNREVVFQGAVDDQYGLGYSKNRPTKTYLKDALNAVLAGKKPAVARTSAPGCRIKPLKTIAKNDLTYHKHISRIVQNRCISCHREGGPAPFALEDADQLLAHAGMIEQVITDGTMPPWFAKKDSEQPEKWLNDRSLTNTEKERLLSWLDGEGKIGNPKHAPPKPTFPKTWQIGEPDVIVQLPRPVRVRASGVMDYVHKFVEIDLPEDKWIQAVEIRPTSPEVVHHVLVFTVDKDDPRPSIDESEGFVAAYVPGNTFQIFPKDFAKRLPGNKRLLVQMHYTPNGTKTTDQTKIAFKFAEKAPKYPVETVGIFDHRLRIPPGAPNHKEFATEVVPQDRQLLAFFPHMHLRGKAIRYDYTSPSGEKTELLDVPAYDFNWQLEYRLRKPFPVKKGGKLTVTGWFDNSSDNPANPDPSKLVRWGDQTYDEMLIGYMEYYVRPKVTKEKSE